MIYKVYGYARITPKEEKDGYKSLKKQEEEIKKYAESLGVKNIEILTDEPIGERTGLIDTTLGGIFTLLDLVRQNRRAQFVIVTSLDRLKRHETDVHFFAELVRINKKVLEVGEDYVIDATNIEEDYDYDESFDDIKSGRPQSGPVPYGYKKDSSIVGNKIFIVPDEVEASVVRYIFETYEKVESYAELQRLLKEREIKTRRDNDWSRAGLSWLLKNDVYLGLSNIMDNERAESHEPLIDKNLFDRVQLVIKKKQRKKRHQPELL